MSTANNDSDDLEALFDSIAASGNEAPAPAPVAAVVAKPAVAATAAGNPEVPEVINKIGHMTRALHDSLRELGYDKNLEKAANAIPDARDRLNYIATMTQQAAERVLNATEAAQPGVEKSKAKPSICPANGKNCSIKSWMRNSSNNWRRAPMPIWWKCRSRQK